MSNDHSVRLTFRLGQKGDQTIEAVTQRGGGVQVKAQSGDDGVVVVEVELSLAAEGGRQAVDGERQGHNAVPYSAEYGAGIRDRHVVRIGDGGRGCVRVLGHEVSPYNWQFVNFGTGQMSCGAELNNLNVLQSQFGVESSTHPEGAEQ